MRLLLWLAAWLCWLRLPLKGEGYRFSAAAKRRMLRKRRETVGRKLADARARRDRETRERSPLADILAEDDEFGGGDDKSPEDLARERWESAEMRRAEKEERSRLYRTILDAGGLKTRSDLREEYSGIPNTYKRRDGMAGDEMAEYLDAYFPEYGISNENDLIQFLAA